MVAQPGIEHQVVTPVSQSTSVSNLEDLEGLMDSLYAGSPTEFAGNLSLTRTSVLGPGEQPHPAHLPHEDLEPLSPSPDQQEIELWIDKYREQRKDLKGSAGLEKIICPLPGCGRFPRRLQALK
ncbi:hypothetical protein FRC07_011025, partial [Ceratobasidium sp. 392]